MTDKIKIPLLWLCAFIVLLPMESPGKRVDKEYRKMAQQYGFKLSDRLRFRGGVSGRRISAGETETELERFFAALAVLPPDFVRRSGIKKVMICRDLTLNNQPAGGVVSEDCIYLTVGFSAKTVYHELFHVFDTRRNSSKWTKLNNKAFRYQGSDFYQIYSQRSNRKSRKRKEKAKSFLADFASSYAQSFEWEDRAETFAHMLVEKERFFRRTRQSPVLHKKMLYIIDVTTSGRKQLTKKFWAEILGVSVSELGK